MSNPSDLTQASDSSSVSAQSDTWQLMALSPELGNLHIPVGTSLRIGRQDTNDVVLASPRISRQHAKLNRIGEKLYVQDLGSANGTFVNGERMTSEAFGLKVGDELAFDELMFVVMQDNDIDAKATLNTLANELNTQKSYADLPQANEITGNQTAETTNVLEEKPLVASVAVTVPDKLVDIDTTQDTPIVTTNEGSISLADSTTTATAIYTSDKAVANQTPKQTINNHEKITDDTSTQPTTNLVPPTESTPSPKDAVIPTQTTVTTKVDAPASQTTTQPTTTVVPTTKTETKKMANIAIVIVVLIALAIIASLFL